MISKAQQKPAFQLTTYLLTQDTCRGATLATGLWNVAVKANAATLTTADGWYLSLAVSETC